MMREGPYPQGPRENRNSRNDRADYVLLVCRTDGTCVPRSVGSWLHHRFPQLLIVLRTASCEARTTGVKSLFPILREPLPTGFISVVDRAAQLNAAKVTANSIGVMDEHCYRTLSRSASMA